MNKSSGVRKEPCRQEKEPSDKHIPSSEGTEMMLISC